MKLKNELESVCLRKKEILLRTKFNDKHREEEFSDIIKKGLNLAENSMYYAEEFLQDELEKMKNLKIY